MRYSPISACGYTLRIARILLGHACWRHHFLLCADCMAYFEHNSLAFGCFINKVASVTLHAQAVCKTLQLCRRPDHTVTLGRSRPQQQQVQYSTVLGYSRVAPRGSTDRDTTMRYDICPSAIILELKKEFYDTFEKCNSRN